jgi:2-oxo-4-hydroxy-4-carboxy-5-ureidoimidazoline decarboxylase
MAQRQPPGLEALNAMSVQQAESLLLRCCASRRWAEEVAAGRPYVGEEALLAAADAALARLGEADLDEALAGHARIGEPPSGADGSWSRREQSRVSAASDETLAALAEHNRAYEERFGHVYLVCATGMEAGELLAVLRRRLRNDAATERRVLRAELGKINRLRLGRLVEDGAAA